jgi:hypothetical protein
MYASYCHLHCELLRKPRLMCCAEGQHYHSSHLAREPEDMDAKKFNEWVDTDHELHVSTSVTVKDTTQRNIDGPQEHATRKMMKTSINPTYQVANVVSYCHLKKVLEHTCNHKYRTSLLSKSPVFISLHIQGHFWRTSEHFPLSLKSHPWTINFPTENGFNLFPCKFKIIHVLCSKISHHINTPTTALWFDTMIFKNVVNLLHVLAFVGHLQGCIQQRKIH